MEEDKFLTKKEAAVYLRISERRVTDLVTARAIPFRRHSERTIVFHSGDLKRWSEGKKEGGGNENQQRNASA